MVEALKHEGVIVDVLQLDPMVQAQGSVRPHPVHQVANLQQERDDSKSAEQTPNRTRGFSTYLLCGTYM